MENINLIASWYQHRYVRPLSFEASMVTEPVSGLPETASKKDKVRPGACRQQTQSYKYPEIDIHDHSIRVPD